LQTFPSLQSIMSTEIAADFLSVVDSKEFRVSHLIIISNIEFGNSG